MNGAIYPKRVRNHGTPRKEELLFQASITIDDSPV